MADLLTKLAYQTLQRGKSYFSLTHKALSYRLSSLLLESKTSDASISREVLHEIQQQFEQLLEVDWQDAKQGIYATDLLFQQDWQQFLPSYANVWLDLPRTWQRQHNKEYQVFSTDLDRSKYPQYYLQNFHYQTDGYLSDRSADLYDLQVDILFNGGADAMRRRILAPLKAVVMGWPRTAQPVKILDVACGTGRTLEFIHHTCPQASLYGIDLSSYYLRKANQSLSNIPGELPQLIQGNGEELPYVDNYFHVVTSTFLFHELPPKARQRVLAECWRVLKPEGTLILCDSIQAEDNPRLDPILSWFPRSFHEPYYNNYLKDNLERRLESIGFTENETRVYYMSKYWVAKKPRNDRSNGDEFKCVI
ncbi:class I SAM-dependent methyltransferase [Roseofilum casamattae]|uniref:Class I SAM-dependent methyltransferase n=1 Tax=Roseofilum casamattae BLCC-M143 TaxID=3022442 RepID=A0ABT7BYI4_9CYAN|nr:class I SAM-dependent methyltransferase [Roseofilum casamattae]MDJ1184216.1 class I SAM-dependent methyltransferase [Roseofilum casamattae BLCC-M143]